MVKDLRYFIDYLEENAPEELVRVDKEVDPRFELAGVLRKFQQKGEFPAVFFENVKDSNMPVIANVFASIKKLASALEVDVENVTQEYRRREEESIPTKLVGTGPVKDVVVVGDEVDLTKIPVPTHNEKDMTMIGIGVTVMKDPETGLRNCGVYRQQINGRNKLGILHRECTYAYSLYRKAWDRGEPLEVATFIGHHPACIFGGLSRKFGLGVDELDVAGGIMGEPLEVVKCETVDLEVPAYAEIVIEGKIPPNRLEFEAPFGEYHKYYGPQRLSPICEVTAITHRRDAIFHDLFNAHREHLMSIMLPRASILYKRTKASVPQTIDARHANETRYVAYVKIRKDYDGLGKNAGIAALAADPLLKIVVVVDEDVDINNEGEVIWAISTRTQPDRNIQTISDTYIQLDPSGYSIKSRSEHSAEVQLNTKVIIDATKPVGLPFQELAEPPKEVWEKINLKEYIK